MTGLFVTGTDTGCGKTQVSLALMALLQSQGLSVLGMKPVASGCERTPDGLRNADAVALQIQSSRRVGYHLVNPYAFEPPIAPHIAAARAGIAIRLPVVESSYRELCRSADRVLVEGVGGWRVPLGEDSEVGDIPARLGLPVILVVGLKLGAINHALLSRESIVASGARLAGWIANQVEPEMRERDANLATLLERIPEPCLGVLPWRTELATPTPERYGNDCRPALWDLAELRRAVGLETSDRHGPSIIRALFAP